MDFIVQRGCGSCKNIDEFKVSKVEAGFGLYDFDGIPCSNCNSTKFGSMIHPRPDLDEELLGLWGKNPDYYFTEQDEDIILAEVDNLELILKAIDKSLYPEQKQNVLISALCILLYDNVELDEEMSDEELKKHKQVADKVLPELVKRKKNIENAKKDIMLYIREVVFPLVDIKD